MGFSKSSAKGKVHSNTNLPQETIQKSNSLTLHLKELEKEEMKNPRVSRRKGKEMEPIVVLKRTSHKIAKSVSSLIKKVRGHT